MTDQPAGIWFERRVSPAAVLALLILGGVSCWLGWYAYRGELSQIFSATPSIEIDLAPQTPPSAQSAAAATTPSIVIDLTPATPAAAPAHPAVAAIPLATPIAPAAAPAATVAAASAPVPDATPSAPADSTPAGAALTAPVLQPPANAPASQTEALASANPPAAGTSTVNSPTPIAPGIVSPAPASGQQPATPPVTAEPAPVLPATGPAAVPAPASTSGAAAAPATPAATAAATAGTAPVGTPPPPPSPGPSVVASATTPSAPVATTPPGTSEAGQSEAAQAEASSADLLSALGKAPAPVTQTMAAANANSAAPGLAIVSTTAGGAATGAASTGGGTQTATVIDNFLPQSGDSTAPAWQRNARPFDVNDPRPRIAIVITKLGLLHGTTLAAIDQLPADITLSFSPYASDLGQWIGHARSLGHEVMLDLPMESSQGGVDPGPDGLLTSLSAEENLQRLNWVIGRAEGYVGLAGLLGDRFTASPVGLRPILRDIARHGLMFLDPHLNADGLASSEATKLHLPRAIADLTIDDRPDRVSIDIQLAELERRARVTGFAVGIANGYPVTIERLADWARSLAERNLALAPVSAIADQQADR